jgi:hypothetical protein
MAGSMLALLSACGGGGSTDGSLVPNPNRPLDFQFSADKTLLQLNLANDAPVAGSPYTARVNMRASYVPGAGGGGNCWSATFTILSGAASADLYPGSGMPGIGAGSKTYFTVSTSGSWDFMVNALDRVGDVLIEAAIPNPDTAVVRCNDDKVEVGPRYETTPITYLRTQYTVKVGAASTQRPAQVVLNRSNSNFLYLQGQNDPTSMRIQAQILDEAGQPVPNPSGNNLLVRILNAGNTGAYLQSGAQIGNEVRASSINGQAQFTLHSGNTPATLLVEARTDRADNSVDNGIQDVIYNVATVPMVSANPNPANLPLAVADPVTTALCRNQANSIVLQAQGGTLPYTWAMQGTQNLPAGLSFRPDGSFGGVTNAATGTEFQVNLAVRDSAFPTKGEASGNFSFGVVDAPTVQFNPNSNTASIIGVDLDRLGRVVWSVSGNVASTLGADGMSATFENLNQPNEQGEIAPASGSVTVTFAGGCSASTSFTVAGGRLDPESPLTITAPTTLTAEVGVPFSQMFGVSGGFAPYQFAGQNMPPGLTLSASGILAGTPTTAGVYAGVVMVRDAQGNTATANVSITVAPAGSNLPMFSTTDLPDGVVGTQYAFQLQATGGRAPYQFSVQNLPDGLCLRTTASTTSPCQSGMSASGFIGGFPSRAGTWQVVMTVTDAAGKTATQTLPMVVTETAAVPLVLETSDLTAEVGVPFSSALSVTGGTAPYSFQVWGNFPNIGLTLSSNGVFSGTPTTAGTYIVAVRVTDSGNPQAETTGNVAITVAPAGSNLPRILTTSLPSAVVGTPYAFQIQGTGGQAPYQFTAVNLPSGFTLSSSGLIQGNPAAVGVFQVVIRLTDAAGRTVSTTLSITIESVLTGSCGNLSWSGDTPTRLPEFTGLSGATTFTLNHQGSGLFFVELRTAPSGNIVLPSLAIETGIVQNRQQTLSLDPDTRYFVMVSEANGPWSVRLANSNCGPNDGDTGDTTPDSTAPEVAFTIPANSAVNVSPTAAITVVFNEAMDPDSINPGAFAVYRLDNSGSAVQTVLPTVAEIIAESDRRFSITAIDQDPARVGNFVPGAFYRVVLSRSPRDIAGNQITSETVFQFRVGNLP